MYLSKHERNRRYEQLRKIMGKEGIDALVVVGNNHATGNPFFSTGEFPIPDRFFHIFSLRPLAFFSEDDPIMLVPMELQETSAKKYSWINDVRMSLDYAETVTRILEEKKLSKGKIGHRQHGEHPGQHLSFSQGKSTQSQLLRCCIYPSSHEVYQRRRGKTAAEEGRRAERRGLQRSIEEIAARDERI